MNAETLGSPPCEIVKESSISLARTMPPPNIALIHFDGWIDNSSGVNGQLGSIQFRSYH
jgi:hypothetical protein